MINSKYEIEILSDSSSFHEWDSFVDVSPQGCIFCKSWWLRNVCQNGFNILILRKGGKITAGIPLPLKSAFRLHTIQMPPITQTLGVLLEPPASEKYETNLSNSMEITKVLIENLPKYDYFTMNFHYNFTNWLPFYWAGYQQTTRYTYLIDDLTDIEKIYNNLNSKTRNIIRKANNNNISIVDSDDIDLIIELNKKTFSRQGLKLPLSHYDFIKRVNRECTLHNARKIFLAEDSQHRIHSGIFLVYDNNSTYYLIGGGDPELRESGANNLAIWHSIEFAQKVSRIYNFEGSMVPNIELFFRSFGALQMPYFSIKKDNLPILARAGSITLRKARKMFDNIIDIGSSLKLLKH